MALGNTQTEQTCSNTRLQPTVIRVGTSASSNCTNVGNNDLLNLAYTYNPDARPNNGDVGSQTITRPVAPGTARSWTQSYHYDALDRLFSADEGSDWTQVYNYDAYGNRAVSGYNPRPDWTWVPSNIT